MAFLETIWTFPLGCFGAPSFVTVVLVVAILDTALSSGFRAAPADSAFLSTFAFPPPGWYLMLSVDPILERMFFRSGADTLVGGRGGLGTGLVLGATLSVDAFLKSVAVLAVPDSLGAAGLGLGRLAVVPGKAGEAMVGVVALLLAVEEAAVLFG